VIDVDTGRGDDAERPLLNVTDLHVWYPTNQGVVRAVDGVTMSVASGRAVGIVGESGSGKSVLCRAAMGLLTGEAYVPEGAVQLRGRDLLRLRPQELRRIWGVEVAMVFQDPMTSLNPVVRIGRQITESLKFHLRCSNEQAKARAVNLLEQVGLTEPDRRLRQYPHQLSGGMRQRVGIAIALACEPQLLFADEPTTALDVTIQRQVLDLLDESRRAREMSMVIVSHDLGVVAGRTDEIIVMYAGQIVERAPTRAIFERTRHPYTEALIHAIPELDDPPHTLLATIPGRPPDAVSPASGCRFAARCRYAQERCIDSNPALVVGQDDDHEYACFFPVGTAAGASALARNMTRGVTATGMSVDRVEAPA
jgi:peptide/nickel transport system ATP-binding protein